MTISADWNAYLAWAGLCAVGLVGSLAGEYRSRVTLTAAGKSVSALAYLGAALAMGALEHTWGRLLFAGLVCCFAGDLLLVSRNSRTLFRAGLIAFLAGHLVYVAAFVSRGAVPVVAAIASLPLILLAVAVMRWLLPHVDARMRLPVLLYIVAISVMVAVGTATYSALGGWTLFCGVILFYLSDLFVARNRFVAPGFVNRAVGLPLYFAAQMLLVATLID